MKLSEPQIEKIQATFGVIPIDDGAGVMDELKSVFGDHTFYLTQDGLIIWEYVEGPETDGQPAIALQIAAWTGEEKKDLTVHDPKATDVVVSLS